MRALLGKALVMSLIVMGTACSASSAVHPVLSAYLRALVSRDYATAYRLTTLPSDAAARESTKVPSPAAITEAHFAAFEQRDPVESFRILRSFNGVAVDVELRRSHQTTTESLILNSDHVAIELTESQVHVVGGPLPNLSVDGVLANVPLRSERVTSFLGPEELFDDVYDFYVIAGEHVLSATEGPATAALTKRLGPQGLDLTLTLHPNSAGNTAADSVVAGWKNSCNSRCTLKICGAPLIPLPFASAVVIDGKTYQAKTHELISLGAPGWSIGVSGQARVGSRLIAGTIIVDISQKGSARLRAACLGA